MRKAVWIVMVVLLVVAVAGTVLAQETDDYKLNVQLDLEKVDKPVTLFGDIAASTKGFKLGLRYKVVPDVFVAMHMGLKEDRPLDLEVVYRAHTGMDFIRVYGGIGVNLNNALFGGYLIGGVEAAVLFLELSYLTGESSLQGWGGLRLPIF
ncbi:MAG: hypothetical protein GX316_02590 [Firmicutes bacterium]|nr:hypothetical protein [Bacillota bacterium]